MRVLALGLSSLLLCSCMAPRTYSPRLQTFNESDYIASQEDGTSTITGEAFLPARGGGLRAGAGRSVQLMPVTPYTTEIITRQYLAHERLTPAIDNRVDRHTRATTADSRGQFRFERIPAGSYYLLCPIYRDVPQMDKYDVYYEEPGGTALGQVTVGPGEIKRITVTR